MRGLFCQGWDEKSGIRKEVKRKKDKILVGSGCQPQPSPFPFYFFLFPLIVDRRLFVYVGVKSLYLEYIIEKMKTRNQKDSLPERHEHYRYRDKKSRTSETRQCRYNSCYKRKCYKTGIWE
jgi:hypothetical protein